MKTLYVYKPEDLSKPVWYAPFKDDASLVAAIMERKDSGFVFNVKEEPVKIRMSFTMTKLEPTERIIIGHTYCSMNNGRTVGICNNRKFLGAYAKDFSEYTFWKLDNQDL